MGDQTVVVGFRVTGASAAHVLLELATDPSDLVVVDQRPDAIEQAVKLGARAVEGDGIDRRALGPGDHASDPVHDRDGPPGRGRRDDRGAGPAIVPVLTAVQDGKHVALARRVDADHVLAAPDAAGRAMAAMLRRPA